MKARFSISATVTLPGTYSQEAASHSGDLHFGGGVGDAFDRQAAQRALAQLDERWRHVRLEIEASLLATIAEREQKEAEAKAKAKAEQERLEALYAPTVSEGVPDESGDDLPI